MALTKLNFSGSGQGALSTSDMPSGSVIQTVSTNLTSTTDSTAFDANFENVSGLTVNITPSSTSNKVYVIATLQVSVSGVHVTFRIARGGSAIVSPDSPGNRMAGMAHIYGSGSFNDHYDIESKVMQVLDSPSSTSQLTYSVQGRNVNNPNSTNLKINRTNEDSNAGYNSRVISTITAMEIKG